jgi:hypothetical protein
MIQFAVLACYDEDYYTLTPEDREAKEFIKHSYLHAEVVDIEGIRLSVDLLQIFFFGGCVIDDVSYLYI